MNEFIFLLQIVAISAALLAALSLGKEALVSLVSLCGVLANLCVLKQIDLFGLTVTASDAYMVAGILGLNMIQEHFGKLIARKTIRISFMLLLFYLGITYIHLLFTPSAHDTTQPHFLALFTPMPRIIIASVVVYLTVQCIDYMLYGFLKNLLNGRYLILRNVASLVISQGIDTVLFSFLGLYGIVASIGSVIAFSFAIKILVIGCATPLVGLTLRFARTNQCGRRSLS